MIRLLSVLLSPFIPLSFILVGVTFTPKPADEIVAACVAGDTETGESAVDGHVDISFDELLLVCKVVTNEAGSDWLSDEHQQLVASVLLNRVASPEFPDTISECVYQPGQYYGVKSKRFQALLPDERTAENVLYVIQNGGIAPPSVVFQSGNKRQGSGVWKSIEDEILPTTYFCYSSYPELYETEAGTD
jgi:N-acetylmuramoyl-L-alanine amidase